LRPYFVGRPPGATSATMKGTTGRKGAEGPGARFDDQQRNRARQCVIDNNDGEAPDYLTINASISTVSIRRRTWCPR
jgi:hypothetical protein